MVGTIGIQFCVNWLDLYSLSQAKGNLEYTQHN